MSEWEKFFFKVLIVFLFFSCGFFWGARTIGDYTEEKIKNGVMEIDGQIYVIKKAVAVEEGTPCQ